MLYPGGDFFVRPAALASPVALSKAVNVLLGAVILTDLAALATGGALHSVMGEVAAGQDVSDAEFDRADLLYQASAIFQALAVVATGVVFLVWFHRVRLNAEVFDPQGQRLKRGWTVWGWFVPFAMLVIPRRIAGDIWDASTPIGPDGTHEPVSYKTLNVWWAAWIISGIASWQATLGMFYAEDTEAVEQAVGLELIADVLDIVAAVLAVLFVRKLTRRQNDKVNSGSRPPISAAA